MPYLFGGKNIEQQVVDDLKAKASLSDGQVMTNIRVTTEQEIVFGGVVIKKKVKGTADVVQFR